MDKVNQNIKVNQKRRIAILAERSAAQAHKASAPQSAVGQAISTANTALAVYGDVMGAYGKVMGATGALAERAVVAVFSKLSFMQGLACLPASSQLDPVMGIDVHLVMIPPSPSPIPMPHPYIAVVFNPKDWIACAVMSVVAAIPPPPEDNAGAQLASTVGKMALGMVMGKLGLGASVKLGGLSPRTISGVTNKVIPHFPMGASFAPIPVLKNSGHAQFGSLFVLADGEPFTGMMHLNNDCWDIGIMALMRKKAPAEPMHLYMPTGFVMAIPSHNVIVNPIPTPINPIAALTKVLNFGLAKLLHKILNKLPGGRLSNALHKAVCHVTGHPVDVVSGMLFTDEEDFLLPGVIPFSWERTWYSDSDYRGPLGYGWYHNYDMGFVIDEKNNQAIYRMNDGRVVGFELPLPGKFTYDRKEKLFLHCHTEEKFYYITDRDGLIYRFTDKIYKNEFSKKGSQRLISISNMNGYSIRFVYNAMGWLVKITDSAGRILIVENDKEGRISSIIAPHPSEQNSTFIIAQYEYDEAGNMICHTDALNQKMSFEYQNHLLTKETWRNGMQWYFAYDGKESGAKCIHTWGDGDLYNHKLTYSEGRTVVENSLHYTTTYHHKGGLLYTKIDGKGGVWVYRYNRFNELEWETDPLGHQQSYTHDEWGNLATSTDPAGGFNHTEYYNLNFPLFATEKMNAAGGKWKWEYDESGNTVGRTNPLGAKTKYNYNDGLLTEIVKATGAVTRLTYDKEQNLIAIQTHDGAITTCLYDRLGNCIRITNPKGAKQKRTYDIKGRIEQMNDFDGNIIDLKYDEINNVIRYRDKQKDVEYTYRGLWKLTSRREAGVTIIFKYNTEEQLRKIINEHNLPYSFELDPVGNVVEEIGFDNIRQRYERNAAGWITKVNRNKGKYIQYEYDPCGRVTHEQFSDGSTKSFTYRSDGLMMSAINDAAKIEFERDVAGNILKETVNNEWVTSEYDIFGNRLKINSSLGAKIINQYDKTGNVLQMEANDWKAKFEHDELGLETYRFLPGGICNQWQRDGIGRPVSQLVGHKAGEIVNLTRKKQYLWDTNHRLKQIKDRTGITTFEHDEMGNLLTTIFSDGEVQHRNPDGPVNLLNPESENTGIYGKGEQLKRANGWKYLYDEEGNLIEKKYRDGTTWTYEWAESGTLKKAIRPDNIQVSFSYDALGRRILKRYKNTYTSFLWNGNVLLHEWKEPAINEENSGATNVGENQLITWVFENNGFSPAAKIKENKHYSIISDHLGTPILMYKDDGVLLWDCELDSKGKVRKEKGEAGSCPFRYQGQYEDSETGLYYNRFRYYDPQNGLYISQDPVKLIGGMQFYAYVKDTNIWVDIFGLAETFYRAMKDKHAEKLAETGKMPASNKETMISPTLAYIKEKGYTGTIVKIEVADGTTAKLKAIGVADPSHPLVREQFGELPPVKPGWKDNNAFFKEESGQVNIGLGKGKALDTFNDNIVSSEVVD